jgi:branched-chain amino acid transport system substrate-binding protein
VPQSARRTEAAALLAAVAVLLAACTASPAPTPTPTPPPPSGDGILRIGTLLDTHGAGAALAAGQTAGVNAALRDIDAAGGVHGVPVEVVNRDAADPDAVAQLLAAGVDAIIGPSDVDTAAALIEPARDARIPLLSPSAVGPRPEGSDGVLWRTVPSARAEGAALAHELGDGTVALVRDESPATQELAQGLAGELGDRLVIEAVAGDDPAADAARVAAKAPDAVLVALPGGEGTGALLGALIAAGVDAGGLWVTGGALSRYDADAGSLAGLHGIQTAVPADPAFAAQLRREDPGAGSTRYAAEAYDAVVLVALAALAAGDDGGPSITAALPAVATGGIPCASFAECVAVAGDGQDIDFDGPSGPFSFDQHGDRHGVRFVLYLYDDENVPRMQP